MARASCTSWRSPTDSWLGLRSSSPSMPNARLSAVTRIDVSRGLTDRTLSGRPMLSRTVVREINVGSGNTMPRSRSLVATRVTSRSPMKTRPSTTGSSPAITLSKADFPAPDRPSTAITSPSSTVMDIPSRIIVLPTAVVTDSTRSEAMSSFLRAATRPGPAVSCARATVS